MCVCVCVCVCVWRAVKLTGKVHFELRARPNDQIHTKYVKTAGLESLHFNTVYSGYGKYSDPLKMFTLCYIAAIC